jgi:glutamyl-tRNA reductase
VHATKEELRLLVVEADALSPTERVYLLPRESEVRDWHIQAAEQGVSLVVLRTEDTIELYSTQNDRQLACSPPLMTLAQKGQLRPELGRVRVVPRRGLDVVRHLFHLAAGIGMSPGKAKQCLSRIQLATLMASKAGCLGATVESLFRTAIRVGLRVESESLVGRPKSSASLREIAEIGASRIVEEEITNWQTEQTHLFRSLSRAENFIRSSMTAPPPSRGREFRAHEAPSGVRIKASKDVSEELEEEKQASG